jgi:hypothetical protein
MSSVAAIPGLEDAHRRRRMARLTASDTRIPAISTVSLAETEIKKIKKMRIFSFLFGNSKSKGVSSLNHIYFSRKVLVSKNRIAIK